MIDLTDDAKKQVLLRRFLDALDIHGMEDLRFVLEDMHDQRWYDMDPDQIWKEQAERVEEYTLPDDLQVFYSETPDWDFAESSLEKY